MGTKIFGIILFAFAIYLFRLGFRFDDRVFYYSTSIRKIGVAILALIGACSLLTTTKSLCELFGIFC